MTDFVIPTIKRAREFKLYTYDGKVLLDLYRENGRGFCGYKFGKLVFTLKNLAEQGVFAAYPSVYENRLKKALLSAFPQFSEVAFFANLKEASNALGRLSTETHFSDPILEPTTKALRWRPTLPIESKADFLLVTPPDSGFSTVEIILSNSPLSTNLKLSPVEAGVLTRVFYDWIALSQKGLGEAPSLDLPAWEQKGFYMRYKGEDYQQQWKKALTEGVLLSPPGVENSPVALLPLSATKGEWGKIRRALS